MRLIRPDATTETGATETGAAETGPERRRAGPVGRLHGSLVAMVTPFERGQVDSAQLVTLCERQIGAGSAALVVCGSTGEAASLSPDEYARVTVVAVAAAAGRVPVLAGCGAPSTEQAVLLAASAARAGVDALLCAPPPYSKPTQEGIVAHVRAVGDSVDLPVVLYDVPGRTGVAVADKTVARLFKSGLIVGIKDAGGDAGRPARLRARFGDGLLQFSGDDATAPAHRAMGGHGCVSVTANLTPGLCARLHRAWDEGDLTEFARIRDLLSPLHDALFVESNPIPVKAALVMAGLCGGELRLPLTRAGHTTADRLADILPALLAADDEATGQRRLSLVK